MRVTVNRLDLKPEFSNINCLRTRLEHFKPEVQAIINSAGEAMFYEYDGSNYNAIIGDSTLVKISWKDEALAARKVIDSAEWNDADYIAYLAIRVKDE